MRCHEHYHYRNIFDSGKKMFDFGGDTQESGGSLYHPKRLRETDYANYDAMMRSLATPNPYAAEGNQYATLANSMMTNAQGMQGGQYADYLNQYLTGAFNDDQNAVYQELLSNTQQGARSAATARGLNTSPYGAGLENEAVRQMNLNWATNEQARQQQALSGYLAGQTGMQGLGQNALSTATALESLKKGWNQQDISNMLNYIGLGTGAQNTTKQTSGGLFSDLGDIVSLAGLF